jgi:hypothetical protein
MRGKERQEDGRNKKTIFESGGCSISMERFDLLNYLHLPYFVLVSSQSKNL